MLELLSWGAGVGGLVAAATSLVVAVKSGETPLGKGRTRYIFGGCERIVERAVAVLPAAERDRYLEEYRSELYDLTADGASRRARVMWSIRVLVRAPLLRRELRKPQQERAW